MCRVLRLALLGALLAFPLAADQPAQSSPKSPSAVACALALSPMSTAQVKSCPLNDPECQNQCIPVYDNCEARVYNSITFVNQKPNLVCVYVCNYTDTCYDSECSRPNPRVTNANFRVRSEPYEFPLGGCPAADLSFCVNMAVDY